MNKPKMITKLSEDEVISGFELINIHDFNVREIVNSNIPEEILLAILGDFGSENKTHVISKILEKLQRLSGDSQTKLERYIRQLLVLSRLRKLEQEIEKIVKQMPITYDITTDHLYQEGKIEGKMEEKKETIIEMLKDPSMTDEKIARFVKTSVEFVREIKKSIKK